MLTIGKMAKRFGLSRSALLYYDSIGLLRPSARGANGYRFYSPDDQERLRRILRFRDSGLPLEAIGEILARGDEHSAPLLERQLDAINDQIRSLRDQQRRLADFLGYPATRARRRSLTCAEWVALLEAAGLSAPARANWHVEFERLAPEAHQDFLESLGLEAQYIVSLRQSCRHPIGA